MKKSKKKVAVVHCSGACSFTDGVPSCSSGCLSCGECAAVCKKDAVTFDGDSRAALISRELCVGCGLCVKACPQELITLEAAEDTIQVLCSNHDAGRLARQICTASCIACGLCEKNCPSGAIYVTDNCAVTDKNRCIACGMCAVQCPRGVIHDANGIFTAV